MIEQYFSSLWLPPVWGTDSSEDDRQDVALTRDEAISSHRGTDRLLLGLDGGASKTTALIGDLNGHVLGKGRSGPSNLNLIGVDRAIEAIDKAIDKALQDSKVNDQQIGAVVIGLAGAEVEENRLKIVDWLTNRMPERSLDVVHDTALVLAAGTPSGWGLVIISGAGSVAFGRDQGGSEVYAGKWGRIIGDDGSGYAIGVAILKAVGCADDGRGPKTILEDIVYEHFSVSGMENLVRHIDRGRIGGTDIAGLAPLAERAALAGDPVASEIIKNAGAELAKAAWAVASRLAFRNKIPCALGGSTITKGQILSDIFASEAVKLGLDLYPIKKVPEPAIGALLLASRLVN